MSLSQSKVKKSLPINKVTRSCVEGETSDMVFLEPHLTDEVVSENFMDPPEQDNFQDRHKIVIPIEKKTSSKEKCSFKNCDIPSAFKEGSRKI